VRALPRYEVGYLDLHAATSANAPLKLAKLCSRALDLEFFLL
jgi:hypothetical protein